MDPALENMRIRIQPQTLQKCDPDPTLKKMRIWIKLLNADPDPTFVREYADSDPTLNKWGPGSSHSTSVVTCPDPNLSNSFYPYKDYK